MKRMFILMFVVCLTTMTKAQFYDGADEIYYYVEDTANPSLCFVFNFDGERACVLNQYTSTGTFYGMYGTTIGTSTDYDGVNAVKYKIKNNPNYYDDRVETLDYKMYYDSSASSSNTVYFFRRTWNTTTILDRFEFSSDRKYVYVTRGYNSTYKKTKTYKRVDKSYFRTGRSRNMNGGMYE